MIDLQLVAGAICAVVLVVGVVAALAVTLWLNIIGKVGSNIHKGE